MKIPRFPPIKIRPDGSKGCRGCGGDIPKNRQTWCSFECHKKFDPFYVQQAVRERSGEKCEKCGVDCSRKAQSIYRQSQEQAPCYLRDCNLSYPYDSGAYHNHPLWLAYHKRHLEWKRNMPRPEYDHIIPHSEGGKFIFENIQLLCHKCHAAKTAQWRREHARPKRSWSVICKESRAKKALRGLCIWCGVNNAGDVAGLCEQCRIKGNSATRNRYRKSTGIPLDLPKLKPWEFVKGKVGDT